MIALPRVEPGQEVAAEHIRALYDALAAIEDDLAAARRAGHSPRLWIKLTGGGRGADAGPKYAWTRQVEQEDGAWADSPIAGTADDDAAHEVNGNEDIKLDPPPIVEAWRHPLGGVCFQLSQCGT